MTLKKAAAAIAIVTLVALGSSAARADDGPIITGAIATPPTLQISGQGFRPGNRGALPTVMMGGGPNGSLQTLTVEPGSTDTLIIALLPTPTLPAGSYRVLVSIGPDGNDDGSSVMIDVTLGQSGPVGSTGPMGPMGLQGAPGPAGPAGATGPAGGIGPAGAAGQAGPAGPAGPIGPTGPLGPAGPVGPTGAVGPAGPIGATGATGPAGSQGPTGPIGVTGSQGSQGPAGPQGSQGPAGATGSQGPQGLTGPQGDTGPQGAQGPAFGFPPPVFNSAITAQIEPIGDTDSAYVELSTLVNQPYSVNLVNVTTISGTPGDGTVTPAFTSFGEEADERLCPYPAQGFPGGLGCYQYFRIYFPYSACQWTNAQYQFVFQYTTGGFTGPTSTVNLSSNNWCTTNTTITAPPPIVNAVITPTAVMLGRPFQLHVSGDNLFAGGTIHAIVNGQSLDANVVTLDANDIVVVVPTDAVNRSTTVMTVVIQTGADLTIQVTIPVMVAPPPP